MLADNGANGTQPTCCTFEETYSVNAGWSVSLAEFTPMPVRSVVVHVHRRAGAVATCNPYTLNASNN